MLFVLELIFKSSNIKALFLLDLIVLIFLVLSAIDASFFVMSMFLIFSLIIDVYNFQIIGLTALSLFISLLIIKILGNFVTVLNFERRNVISLLCTFILFTLIKYLLNYWLNNISFFDIGSLIENIIILFIFNYLAGKITNTKYVLK